MNNDALLIFSFLSGVRREKGLALLSRTAAGLCERDAFDAQAARNEAIFSQIKESGLPQSLFLPHRILQSLALRTESSFREGLGFGALSEWYLFHLEQPAQQTALALVADWPGLSASQSSAVIHLLGAIGIMGQLRDAGLTVYGYGEVSPESATRIKLLARTYLARERLFLNLAGETLRFKLHDLKLAEPSSQNLFDDFMRNLKDGHIKSLFSQTSATLWFETIDSLLEGAHRALNDLLDDLANKAEEDSRFRPMANALDNGVENELAFLATLPLFRGMTEPGLRAALQNARILKLDKSQPVLVQSEPTDRLFIVLEGLVKSYKTAEEGNEVVIQVLGKKETLLDAGLLNGPSPIGARTVARSRLLSLSLAAIREQSARNSVLTSNLLALLGTRHQKLLAHFEQITLRQARARVGWFLVNLHLETGLEGAPLKLPFDKALIASYLNITPETFSRVLNDFKKEGFKMEKDEVVLPHPQALCLYCDPTLAPRCCRAEAVECAPIRTVRRAVKE